MGLFLVCATLYLLSLRPFASHIEKGKVLVSAKQQEREMLEAQLKCLQDMKNDPYPSKGIFCNRTWDDIMCWPNTPAGAVAEQSCPGYINGFYLEGEATKRCLEDGTWFYSEKFNNTWTNYSLCMYARGSSLEDHLLRLKIIYNIGYGITLASLASAVFIMLYLRRLHCPRNTLHINMFLSFMLRAAVSFVKENLLVDAIGLPFDVMRKENGSVIFRDEGLHWECKLLFSFFYYVLAANYTWIFVEGLYLHNLITVAIFSEKSGVKLYILLGWGFPLLFIGPWIAVRAVFENELCWNTHPTNEYFWIMKGPITATVIINFAFFLNIIRMLFTKLSMNRPKRARRYRYRKLAKSTLVLIPLFGVHYIVFLGIPDEIRGPAQLVKFYFEMLLNSFQGFFVAILFCYMNGEVKSEIRKRWRRWSYRTNWASMTSYTSRNRNSMHSISSFSCDGKWRDCQSGPFGGRPLQECGRQEGLQPLKQDVRVDANGRLNFCSPMRNLCEDEEMEFVSLEKQLDQESLV